MIELNAAVNTGVHLFGLIFFVLLGSVPRSGVDASYGSYIFSLLRCFHACDFEQES